MDDGSSKTKVGVGRNAAADDTASCFLSNSINSDFSTACGGIGMFNSDRLVLRDATEGVDDLATAGVADSGSPAATSRAPWGTGEAAGGAEAGMGIGTLEL